jgi:dihydrodipicolinate synthase/N-acetylneuraminate lyase
MFALRGIVPIINTPFTENDSIDFASLERLLERSIDDGITGCIVPAVASEVSKLTRQERRDLVRATTEIADGRIEVIAGVSSEDINETLQHAEYALSRGLRTVLCQVPQSLDGDEPAIRRHFTRVAEVGQQHIDISIHFLKQYCVAVGVFATNAVREPIHAYDEIHQAYGAHLIKGLLAIEDELRANLPAKGR